MILRTFSIFSFKLPGNVIGSIDNLFQKFTICFSYEKIKDEIVCLKEILIFNMRYPWPIKLIFEVSTFFRHHNLLELRTIMLR